MRSLATGFLCLLSLSVAAQDAGDRTPPTMIAFFTSATCPAGWDLASAARGRVLIGTTDANGIGKTSGQPMRAAESPQHTHSYSGSVKLSSKEIAAANGCCGEDGAKKGTYSTGGNFKPADSAYPFRQLVVCRKK